MVAADDFLVGGLTADFIVQYTVAYLPLTPYPWVIYKGCPQNLFENGIGDREDFTSRLIVDRCLQP